MNTLPVIVAEVTLISGLVFVLASEAPLEPAGADSCRMKPVTLFLIDGINKHYFHSTILNTVFFLSFLRDHLHLFWKGWWMEPTTFLIRWKDDVPRTAVGPTLSSKQTTSTMANLNTVSAFLSLRTPPPSALAFSAPLRFSNKFLSRFWSSLRSPAISSKAKGCVWWGRRRRAPFFTHSPFQICCKWCKLFSHNFRMWNKLLFFDVKKSVAFHFFFVYIWMRALALAV